MLSRAEEHGLYGLTTMSIDLGAVLNAIDSRALSVGVGNISTPEQTLFHVSCIFFEVDLGSFAGYYNNSAGNHASAAVAALEAIGAVQTAAIVRRANALFPGGNPSPDREEPAQQLKTVERESAELLDSITSEFYHRTGEDIDDLMEAFAVKHQQELPVSGPE